MIQYDDIQMRDVMSYWGSAILLNRRGGKYTACRITNSPSREHGIELGGVINHESIGSYSLRDFIRAVVIHHPPVGYGDYHGIPLYLSPRAGHNLIKGVDTRNLEVLCPVNLKDSVAERIAEIRALSSKAVEAGGNITEAIRREYANLSRMFEMVVCSGSGSAGTSLSRLPDVVLALVLEHCVNDQYPSLSEALGLWDDDTSRIGVSISPDIALLKKTRARWAVYHRMTPIGTITRGRVFTPSKRLSPAAQVCMRRLLSKVGDIT